MDIIARYHADNTGRLAWTDLSGSTWSIGVHQEPDGAWALTYETPRIGTLRHRRPDGTTRYCDAKAKVNEDAVQYALDQQNTHHLIEADIAAQARRVAGRKVAEQATRLHYIRAELHKLAREEGDENTVRALADLPGGLLLRVVQAVQHAEARMVY